MGYNAPPQKMLLFLTVFTSFKGGPVESMGHNVQNMLLAAFVIVINTMFKAGPFREGHNVFPQSMLLAAILTRFKGGHIESTGHNVFPQMMLFFFQFLQGARTHTSQGDECSGARPLRDSYGTLTGPFGPFEFRPTPIHATPFETKLIMAYIAHQWH